MYTWNIIRCAPPIPGFQFLFTLKFSLSNINMIWISASWFTHQTGPAIKTLDIPNYALHTEKTTFKKKIIAIFCIIRNIFHKDNQPFTFYLISNPIKIHNFILMLSLRKYFVFNISYFQYVLVNCGWFGGIRLQFRSNHC